MGRGRSGIKKSGGGGGKANTPSGISYKQFMAMSDDQKYQTIDNIINDSSIAVPVYLDGSETSKVMYALGMNNKPTVVSDDQLDKIPGKDLYRTVYESGSMPPPSSADVLDQIRNGDYTQLSGKGGSAHGRALYFAEDGFYSSASYGDRGTNALVMRTKIKQNANIVDESTLSHMITNDSKFYYKGNRTDQKAIYALCHGIDGWRDGNYPGEYVMIVNRGILTASSKNKMTGNYAKTPTGRIRKKNGKPVITKSWSWNGAADAN